MHEGMDWDDARVFLAVCRAGSFTKAASLLGVKQSTVSRRIAALETELAAGLFERTTHSTLTPLGQRLALRAEAIEAAVQAFLDDAGAQDRSATGRVRLALTEGLAIHVVMPIVLPELKRRHPGLALELITGDEVAPLGHHEAEIALRFFRPTTGDLVTQWLGRMPTAVLGHRSWQNVELAALEWVAIDLSPLSVPEHAWLARNVARPPVLVTRSYVSQIEAIRKGVGVGLIPRAMLRADPELVELDVGLPVGPQLDLWLVTPAPLREVPRIDAVWRVIKEVFATLEGVETGGGGAGV